LVPPATSARQGGGGASGSSSKQRDGVSGGVEPVQVVINSDKTTGEVKVVEVLNKHGFVPFVVKDARDATVALNRKVVIDYASKRISTELRRALQTLRKQYIVALPWYHAECAPHRYPTGGVYVLASEDVPKQSFFPIDQAYATGVSMVEVEPVIDRELGVTLTGDWIAKKTVTEKVLALRQELRGETDAAHLPGLVLNDTVEFLKKHASVHYPDDPLLNVWKVDYIKTHAAHVKLQPTDYVGLFTSDWAHVSVETMDLSGHKKDMKHYYMLVKCTLPQETVDQLRHVLYENPLRDAWGAFVKRKLFIRAEEVAAAIRGAKLAQALEGLGLRAKISNPEVVHTVCNVFDATPISVNVSKGDDASGDVRSEETDGVSFYSNCVPTHKCARGCLIERGPDRDDGFLWLHGPAAGTTGGTSWKQPQSVCSLPCAGFQERMKKVHLKVFESAGWDPENGFAKLDPVFFI
jgi:hypothetical protein